MKRGETGDRLDATQLKERYYQLDDTANTLLADFRQVEENFRQLDREVREKIALSTKTKGHVIDDIFGEQDAISDSDQGRSFRAFWEFLIHNDRQAEFEHLLQKVLREPGIVSLSDKGVLPLFRDYLVEAGNKVYVVNNLLTAQLSRYLADKGRAENKRILELVSQIEKRALTLRELELPKAFFAIDHLKPHIGLPLNRPLFKPPESTPLAAPEANQVDEAPDAETLAKLFNVHAVDEKELRDFVERALLQKRQISLEEILQWRPPEKGLAELIAYLKIAEERPHSHISNTSRFAVDLPEKNVGSERVYKKIHCPAVVFQRRPS